MRVGQSSMGGFVEWLQKTPRAGGAVSCCLAPRSLLWHCDAYFF